MIEKLKREKHGLRYHPLYDTWLQMKYRCTKKNHPAYPRYGGRGITYDQDWNKFSIFLKDVESTWEKGLSLDRIDNNGNYCKSNVRWATPKEQANNRRNARLIEFNGKSQTLTDWSKETGIKKSTLSQRFYSYNWSVEKLLTTN